MSGETRRRLSPVTFLIVLSCSAAVFTVAVQQFRLTTRFFDIIYMARLLERNVPISPPAIALSSGIFIKADASDVCRSDIVRAGTSILLYNLDLESVDRDYEAWATAADRAERHLLHAIRCFPTDGNAWLRLAMVERTIGAPPETVSRLVDRSQLFAPSEKPVIAARFLLWNRLNPRDLERSRDAVLSDILVYTRYSAMGRDVPIPSPSAAVRAMIQQALGTEMMTEPSGGEGPVVPDILAR